MRLLTGLALALAVGTLPATAAEPARGTVRPPAGDATLGPEIRWTGAHYPVATSPASTLGPSCGADPCDIFHLQVAVAPSYWKTHGGSLRVRIDGYDANQDFDLYVYREDAGGNRIAFENASTGGQGVFEGVSIPSASGRYQIVVVPWAVADSGYTGHARLEVPLRRSVSMSAVPDPARRGPHPVRRLDYESATALVTYRYSAYPEELRGSIHLPLGGDAPFGLIVLLHGRHDTCRVAAFEQLVSPCPETPVTGRVDSYRGYDYLASSLASNGYVVVSANANGTNAYDQYTTRDYGAEGRARVLAATLDALFAWNRAPGPLPIGAQLVGQIDMSRIGLMGHSRGGEGVTRFIEYNRERTDGRRYHLRAVLALAATDFADHNPAGVAFATLLPTCDGDVFDLQGAHAFERGRSDVFPRVQWIVRGANHNFFNTVWTFDDAGGGTSPSCNPGETGSLRLEPEDQRRVGLTLMSAFFRRYVGDERAFEPIVTGASPLPDSACPRGWGPCPDLVRTSYVAPAGARRSLLALDDGVDPLHRTADDAAISGDDFLTYTLCDPTPGSETGACPDAANRSWTPQLFIAWDRPSSLVVALHDASSAAGDYATLNLRVAVADALDFDVVLADADGRTASAQASRFGTALRPLTEWGGFFLGSPAEEPPEPHIVLSQIRIPLARFSGVDLSSLRTIELRFGERTPKGTIYLADLVFQEPAAPEQSVATR